jgi:hypothetical protein
MKKKDPEKTKKIIVDYENMTPTQRALLEEEIKKLEDGRLIIGENYFINYEPSECLVCKHIEQDIYGGLSCEAFPDGIPYEIYSNTHYKKHPLQKGEFIFEITIELKKMYDMFYDENHNRRPEDFNNTL